MHNSIKACATYLQNVPYNSEGVLWILAKCIAVKVCSGHFHEYSVSQRFEQGRRGGTQNLVWVIFEVCGGGGSDSSIDSSSRDSNRVACQKVSAAATAAT